MINCENDEKLSEILFLRWSHSLKFFKVTLFDTNPYTKFKTFNNLNLKKRVYIHNLCNAKLSQLVVEVLLYIFEIVYIPLEVT